MYYKTCTKHVPSTTLYYKVCTKYVPVLHCTTKLAQSIFQYYFVLQSLHKSFFPVLLCTTMLAQSISPHYYFVLLDLHKALPSTTLFYNVCTEYFPALLCKTKFAQTELLPSTTVHYKTCSKARSKHHFVLQFLHKVCPSTTLYYKVCTTHSNFFNRKNFYTQKLLHTTNFYTEKLLHTANFHTQQTFTHKTLTHSAFTHGKCLHTQKLKKRIKLRTRRTGLHGGCGQQTWENRVSKCFDSVQAKTGFAELRLPKV